MAKKTTIKISFKKLFASLLSLVMLTGMFNFSAFSEGTNVELVKNYADTYYHQDGSIGTENDWEIRLSKTAAPTQTENVYEITLDVQTKDTTVELIGSTHGAVTLVLDVSNSMNKRYSGCTVAGCGKSEGHANHHEYDKTGFLFWEWCDECGEGSSAHKEVHEYVGNNNTHLENLQEAVSDFLDEYAETAGEGDRRMVSVAVFGTDAVTIQDWIDVTNATSLASVKSKVKSLSTGNDAYLGNKYLCEGGTNMEAGLVLGRNLLNDTASLAGIPTANQSLILFSVAHRQQELAALTTPLPKRLPTVETMKAQALTT